MMAILMDFPLKGSSLILGSMYGKFSYIWLIFMVNVGRYTVPHMDPMGYGNLHGIF